MRDNDLRGDYRHTSDILSAVHLFNPVCLSSRPVVMDDHDVDDP